MLSCTLDHTFSKSDENLLSEILMAVIPDETAPMICLD